ncbi:hypothetical protein MPER_04504 [Moniliophthora perniciosa FA553]|nr:hypothetical protein MPER_04504 [Moniliophthora perniciosa FA553]
MLDFRYKNAKNQDAKTRSEKEVANAFHRRDRLIIRYNQARESLIKLGVIDGNDKDGTYPHMKPGDTHRLPVNLKRKIGDSRRTDGMLWRLGAASEVLTCVGVDENVPVGLNNNHLPIIKALRPSATQFTQRESGPMGPRPKKVSNEVKPQNSRGVCAELDVEGDDPPSDNVVAATGDTNRRNERECIGD